MFNLIFFINPNFFLLNFISQAIQLVLDFLISHFLLSEFILIKRYLYQLKLIFDQSLYLNLQQANFIFIPKYFNLYFLYQQPNQHYYLLSIIWSQYLVLDYFIFHF